MISEENGSSRKRRKTGGSGMKVVGRGDLDYVAPVPSLISGYLEMEIWGAGFF